MSRSRLLASLLLGPLAIVLVAIVAHEPLHRWLEREPVIVLTGEVGTPHPLGGAAVTVLGAELASPDSDAADSADLPDGGQVVLVDLAIADAAEAPMSCVLQLEATVDGERARWSWDSGATDVTSCYSEDEPVAGAVGFVLPAGEIEDVRVLVGGQTLWIGVPVELAS